MKKISVLLVVFTLCLSCVFAASASSSAQSSSRPVVSTELSTLATPVYRVELYDTRTITQQDINEAVSYYSSQLGYAVSEEEVLDDLISTTLINQAIEKDLKDGAIDVYNGDFNSYVSYQLQVLAQNYGYELKSDEDATNFLSQFGMTYNDFAAELLSQWATEQYVEKYSGGKLSNLPEATDAEIKSFYESNRTMFAGDEYVLPAHVFFSTGDGKDKNAQKKAADAVYRDIKSGKITFEKAVQDSSEDRVSASSGGNLDYWVRRSDEDMIAALGADALKALFELKVGEVSQVIEGPQGYHIFKCLNRIEPKMLSLTDKFNPNVDYTVSYLIAQQLKSVKYQEVYLSTYEKIIADLKSKASLKDLRK